MSLLQPLYFNYGRYTANDDRILLTGLLDPESNKSRAAGVLPPYSSLEVTAGSGTTVDISTGMCVIQDSTTGQDSSPGMFITGIEGTSYSLDIGSTNGTYKIYLQVDDSIGATITNASRVAGMVVSTVTVTTSAAHGFEVGDTVYVVTGNAYIDGIYEITEVPTTTTFKYTNDDPLGGYSASSGYARVPLAVRASTATPSTKHLMLATAVISGGTLGTITDKRKFAAAAGGVHLYKSTVTDSSPTGAAGKMRYDVATDSLYIYSDTLSSWKKLFDGSASTGNGSLDTDSAATAIHHTLGTGANQAAAGNHAHDSRYYEAGTYSSLPIKPESDSSANSAISITSTSYAAIPANDTYVEVNVTQNTYVMVNFSAYMSVNTSAKAVYLGVDITNATTVDITPTAGTDSNEISATDGTAYTTADIAYIHYNVSAGNDVPVNITRIVKITGDNSNPTKFQLQAKIDSGATAAISYPRLSVVPLYQE